MNFSAQIFPSPLVPPDAASFVEITPGKRPLYGAWRRAGQLAPGADDPGLADVGQGIGQKSQMPGPFYGQGQGALVPGTGARPPPGLDLAPVRDISPQLQWLLVVYAVILLGAESAYLTPGNVSWPVSLSLS